MAAPARKRKWSINVEETRLGRLVLALRSVLLMDLIDLIDDYAPMPQKGETWWVDAFDFDDPDLLRIDPPKSREWIWKSFYMCTFTGEFRFQMKAVMRKFVKSYYLEFEIDDPHTIRQWLNLQRRLEQFCQHWLNMAPTFSDYSTNGLFTFKWNAPDSLRVDPEIGWGTRICLEFDLSQWSIGDTVWGHYNVKLLPTLLSVRPI